MATKLKDIAPTVQDALDEIDASKTLHEAMARAFAEIEAATKSADNPFFRSKYADLGSIIGTVKPALVRHRLFFTQCCHPSEDGVIVETVLHHAGGESMSLGQLYVPANKRDAQGFGSAQTYARRYALQTAFGVPTEDDDGNDAVKGLQDRHSASTDGSDASAPRGDGDMSDSALRGCVKTLVHNINGCGSLSDLDDLLDTKDAKDVIEQCQRRFPNWWETGVGLPREFTPLKKLIEQTRQGLANLEREDA